jgi:hypothetical protein
MTPKAMSSLAHTTAAGSGLPASADSKTWTARSRANSAVWLTTTVTASWPASACSSPVWRIDRRGGARLPL